ncbi:hypothetical protein AU468_05280 [Alkalispirochaeta sphaeroplastigenens]|uniref:Uncharacterized protein n=1 Tax=Alkalispirochaeta sphaeroplastigenens TaxID=1187066 RepID=A0A2S4JVN6_9SPIO|nr:hypothetical protein [Alkalispirochaeta sphaeroplastigenens]POR03574.1 hypothetical protein AU468_05280 [Alkalispirochaeta sphaeroplastigenens]
MLEIGDSFGKVRFNLREALCQAGEFRLAFEGFLVLHLEDRENRDVLHNLGASALAAAGATQHDAGQGEDAEGNDGGGEGHGDS